MFDRDTIGDGVRYAKEWHVDPLLGSDELGNGSYSNPYQTPAFAIAAANTDDLVHIHAGDIAGVNIVIDKPLMIKSDAIIYGAVHVTANAIGFSTIINARYIQNLILDGESGSVYVDADSITSVDVNKGNSLLPISIKARYIGDVSNASPYTVFVSAVECGTANNTNTGTLHLQSGRYGKITATKGLLVIDDGVTILSPVTSPGYVLACDNDSKVIASGLRCAYSTGALAAIRLDGTHTLNNVQFDKSISVLSLQTSPEYSATSRLRILSTENAATTDGVGSLVITSEGLVKKPSKTATLLPVLGILSDVPGSASYDDCYIVSKSPAPTSGDWVNKGGQYC